MGRLLVHIVTGPENPTRVALGLLVARAALGAGHDVDVFSPVTASASCARRRSIAGHGVGTGSFREHVDALVAGGATLYASAMSSKARGLTTESLGGLAVAMSSPDRLVELTFARP